MRSPWSGPRVPPARWGAAALAAVLATTAGPTAARGQEPAHGPGVPVRSMALADAPPPGPALLRTPAGAFGASLVVPGAGQAAQGLHRWLAYAGVEVAGWAVRLEAVGAEGDAARAYRDLAWDAARLQAGARRDGSWGYYETMSQYLRSGAYDADGTAPGVQPEPDPSSYNGAVWALARALYLPDGSGGPGTPGYDAALDYYSRRAAGPAFLWSWEGAPGALDRFRELIGEADDAARRATAALGVVVANHLVSAVDALVVARIRADRGIRLESRVRSTDPVGWSLGLRITL